MKAKTKPAPVAARPQSSEWSPWNTGDHDKAFVIRTDIDASDCYDAATMRMEQAEQLLMGEREATGTDDAPSLDPVIIATLALLSQARAAYRAAYNRASKS